MKNILKFLYAIIKMRDIKLFYKGNTFRNIFGKFLKYFEIL